MPKSKLIISWMSPDNGININGPLVFDTDMTDIDDVSNQDNELHADVIEGIKGSDVEDFGDEIEDGDFEYESSCADSGIQVALYAMGEYQIHIVLIPGGQIN
jgi:hypothetical protein